MAARPRLASFAVGVVLSLSAEGAELRFFIRSFIPAGTPTQAAGRCFKTDERGFDANPLAPARVTTEFVLVAQGGTVEIKQASGRKYFRAGETVRLDCETKNVLERKTADVSGLKTGVPVIADGIVQVALSASVANPLTPPILSPRIDYDATLTWDVAAKTLTARFTTGRFPAFEAYAILDSGKPVTLLEVKPDPEASPFSLYDFGLGGSSRVFEVKKRL